VAADALVAVIGVVEAEVVDSEALVAEVLVAVELAVDGSV
jgi:hypothetical protein